MNIEKKIENYAESYVEAYSKYPLGEDKLKITLENLLTNDIMKKDILDKENCTDAYVMVYLKDMVYHFDGYLKCEEYTTKNYK